MPISHLSLVNQKLAFARATISLLNDSSEEQKNARKLEYQALCDAAVFHMMMALHFYLRELAEHHQIKNPSAIHSVQDLSAALQQLDKTSSVSSEILTLSELDDSWLNQLIQYFEQLSKSPEKLKEKKAFGQEHLIEIVELTEVDGQRPIDLTPELLTLWLESFRALVARQRETSAEY